MYKLELKINQLPRSLNKSLRTHYHQYNKLKKQWHDIMIIESRFKGLPNTPLTKAKLKIVRHNFRMLDYDGLVGSLKPVVDGLIEAKVIKDDSWGVLGQWEVNQVFRSKKDGPLLEIEVIQI